MKSEGGRIFFKLKSRQQRYLLGIKTFCRHGDIAVVECGRKNYWKDFRFTKKEEEIYENENSLLRGFKGI